jgi:hypothetical protein
MQDCSRCIAHLMAAHPAPFQNPTATWCLYITLERYAWSQGREPAGSAIHIRYKWGLKEKTLPEGMGDSSHAFYNVGP